MKEVKKHISLKHIQRIFFRSQLILIISLALFLGVAGTLVNLHFETRKRDRNLQNVAEAIARSPLLSPSQIDEEEELIHLTQYLDSLKESLEDIDVISIVNKNRVRVYHSNHNYIGTGYDGALPKFKAGSKLSYTVDATGPSGRQHRAYAAIYDAQGEYTGFVMSIMLMENIKTENLQMLLVFLFITLVAVLIELLISGELFRNVKKSLLGYEPDVFTAMYQMRDNILETLEEGILAVDGQGAIQFANESALHMLWEGSCENFTGQSIDVFGDSILSNALKAGEKKQNLSLNKADIILDCVPLREEEQIIGAIAVLHNRAEYTKLMEDLAGTRYLVDSMRANNHDFTNKLHVILGLIQMEMYEQATSYIQNITMVQRANISKVMNAVQEPAVAALLIGKIARASELNIEFVLQEDCYYSSADIRLPVEMLITVIGNLLDNAFEAMNEDNDYQKKDELLFGIYSRPGAALITVDDTGKGIPERELSHIFENRYSTKGEGRGTGLYQVKSMVENFSGRITVESQEGIGTSFSVTFTEKNKSER